MMPLPSPKQTWVHAVDNKQMLLEALYNDAITAIETDILMGRCAVLTPDSNQPTPTNDNDRVMIPIMAHPPNRTSDLIMTDFLGLVSSAYMEDYDDNALGGNKIIRKIIKLDFKEIATVEPTLKALVALQAKTTESSIVFLNADILPCPGNRGNVTTIDSTEFMETSLKYICKCRDTTRMAFSLGFKTNWTDPNDGYTMEDLRAMSDLISHYHQLVELKIGVVMALNARQLAKSLSSSSSSSLDEMLRQFPQLQILAWTGKGEPAIPKSILQEIQDHFDELQMVHRIGYDCHVS